VVVVRGHLLTRTLRTGKLAERRSVLPGGSPKGLHGLRFRRPVSPV